MSSNMIMMLAAGGFFGIFTLMYIINSIEKAKTRRTIQLTEVQDRVLRLEQLFESMPESVLSPHVKLAGAKEQIRYLATLTKLEPKAEKFKRRLEEAKIQYDQINKEAPKNPKLDPVGSLEELKDVRKKLTTLFAFIQNATRTKSIEPHIAKEEFAKLQQLFTESGAQFYLTQAKREEQEDKTRIALHHYRMAMSEYKKAKNSGAYQSQIQTIQQKLTQLEAAEKNNRPNASEQKNSQLSTAFDEMEQSQASWQKKKF